MLILKKSTRRFAKLAGFVGMFAGGGCLCVGLGWEIGEKRGNEENRDSIIKNYLENAKPDDLREYFFKNHYKNK